MAQGLAGEAYRFIVGGAINTVLSLAVYYVLQLFLPYQVAFAIAWVFGVIVSYYINLIYVFKEQRTRAKAVAFPLVYLVHYVASALLLAALVEWVGVPKEIAPLAVIPLTIPLTFALTRFVARWQ